MAYKVFTNGSPLPASDLNTYLMNQSVMVFANSTARSAALTSPTEGMVTYLEDTNKVEVWTGAAWVDVNDNSAMIPKSTVTATGDLIVGNGNASVTRLGIGTNGQVLSSNGTTATWSTPSSGGLTELATGTLSGSSVSLTSISGSYKYLILRIQNATVSNDSAFVDMTFNSDTGSNYSYTVLRASSATVLNFNFQNGIGIATPVGNSAGKTFSSFIQIYNYNASSGFANIKSDAGLDTNTANVEAYISAGYYKKSAAITSIQIKVSSGNFSGGTYFLYGVN